MSATAPLLVLDTNTIVRAMANASSAAGEILKACRDRIFRMLLTKSVLAEYRRVLKYPEVRQRSPELTERKIALVLARLKYVSDYREKTAAHFSFPRDPDDAKFLELAIEGSATHLVTQDDDLLSLPASHTDAAKRLRQRAPRLRIVTAEEFIGLMRGSTN